MRNDKTIQDLRREKNYSIPVEHRHMDNINNFETEF
jgi:hypothetical protein